VVGDEKDVRELTQTLNLTVDNRGQALPATCSFVFRNKYSDIIGRKSIDLQLAPGRTAQSVPLNGERTHGNNYCELIVSDKQGRSLTWGVAFSKRDRVTMAASDRRSLMPTAVKKTREQDHPLEGPHPTD